MFSTRFTTARDFNSEWYLHWRQALSLPAQMRRKSWELAIVCETLASHGALQPGKRGVGFGVGSETLPGLFADMGCYILATDLLPHDWRETHKDFHALNTRDNVTTRIVDMNWLDGAQLTEDIPERDFDFSWSVCSMDHCGSAWLTKRFLLNQMNVLKPGGIAVHTAEYTLSMGLPRDGSTVYLTVADILDIVQLMQAMGHELAPVDWFLGDSVEDHIIDTAPSDHTIHIKATGYGQWAMCVVFAAKRLGSEVLWLPADEAEARDMIAKRRC